MMIDVDYHPSFQQIAFLLEETGEYSERRLNHGDGEAEKFYRDLKLRGVQVRVGSGCQGNTQFLTYRNELQIDRPRQTRNL